MLKFDNTASTISLLQPVAYKIASAKEDWLPPSLHVKLTEQQRAIDTELRRQERIKENLEREQQRAQARATRLSSRSATKSAGRGGVTGGGIGSDLGGTNAPSGEAGGGIGGAGIGAPSGAGTPAGARSSFTRRTRTDRQKTNQPSTPVPKEAPKPTSSADIYKEFTDALIKNKADLSKFDKPLKFWAFDDTVRPDNFYRYRIRLGVFNPLVSTTQVSDQSGHLKNKVILWSDFSDVTEAVEVPARLYMFAQDLQEAAKIVRVTICRYILGYWYSKDFAVESGETIGKAVAYNEPQKRQDVLVPKTIDYSTGAVLINVTPVNDWTGAGKNLRSRSYFDMLYSYDGNEIRHMSIKQNNWSEAKQSTFAEIKKLEKEPKEPLRAWGAGPAERRITPGGPGGISDEEAGVGLRPASDKAVSGSVA